MQAIEMIGFLVFTIIVAGLILNFVFGVNYSAIQDSFSQMFIPKENYSNLEKLTLTKTVSRLNSCWQQCQFGEIQTDCGNILITENDIDKQKTTLVRTDFTNLFEKYNFCTDCNFDINGSVTGQIIIPAIARISCDENNNNTLMLSTEMRQLSTPIQSETTPPITTISGCPAGLNSSSQTILLTCDDSAGSGCAQTSYRYYPTGTTPPTYTSISLLPISFTIPQTSVDTTYVIEYGSKDKSGNEEIKKTSSCAIAKTP
jgi:hypothetical protein